MGPLGVAWRAALGVGSLLGLFEASRRPFEQEALNTAKSIEAPPGSVNCWQVLRMPLNKSGPESWSKTLGDATKGLERFNWNHYHLVNRGTGENIGFYPGGLRKLEGMPQGTMDTKFGGLCMDPVPMENAMRHVDPGSYFMPLNNCQDYPDRLLEWIKHGWDPTANGGSGGKGF